jgi:hypothetical protein
LLRSACLIVWHSSTFNIFVWFKLTVLVTMTFVCGFTVVSSMMQAELLLAIFFYLFLVWFSMIFIFIFIYTSFLVIPFLGTSSAIRLFSLSDAWFLKHLPYLLNIPTYPRILLINRR